MKRVRAGLIILLLTTFSFPVCPQAFAAITPALAPALQQQERPGGRGGGPREDESDGPREYSEVITEDAITSAGMFDVHEVGDDLFFEIPPSELEK